MNSSKLVQLVGWKTVMVVMMMLMVLVVVLVVVGTVVGRVETARRVWAVGVARVLVELASAGAGAAVGVQRAA